MKQRPETDQIKVPAKTQRAERPAQDRIPVTAQAAETAVPDRIPERRGPAIAAQGKVQGKAQGRAAQTLSPISKTVLKSMTIQITVLSPTVPVNPVSPVRNIRADRLSVTPTIFPMLPVSRHPL